MNECYLSLVCFDSSLIVSYVAYPWACVCLVYVPTETRPHTHYENKLKKPGYIKTHPSYSNIISSNARSHLSSPLPSFFFFTFRLYSRKMHNNNHEESYAMKSKGYKMFIVQREHGAG